MSARSYSPVARTEIARARRDLDQLFARAHRLDEADELVGDVSRYICVRVSGYLEQALAHCARSVCARGTWGAAQHFAFSWLHRTPNPRADEIVKFVQRFDARWADELSLVLGTNEYAQSINALLGIRNDVAHGKSQGVSLGRAYEYFTVVDDIVSFLLRKFEPPT